VRPADGLDITAVYAYTDAALTSIAGPIPGVGTPPGRVGEQLPGTAKNMFTGLVSWSQPVGDATIATSLIYRHVGSRTSSLGDPTRAPAYDTLDARFGVTLENGLNATIFADNLTNEVGILRIIQGAPFQTGDRFTYLNVIRPRTVGLRLSFRY
jgi:outer membrane receptor protein involved in Fe transport